MSGSSTRRGWDKGKIREIDTTPSGSRPQLDSQKSDSAKKDAGKEATKTKPKAEQKDGKKGDSVSTGSSVEKK